MKHILKSILNFSLGIFYLMKFRLFDCIKIENAEIVFFLPYYHTGGAERVHLNILQVLKERKCCVVFTHLSSTKNFYEDFKNCSEIIELNSIINKKNSFITKKLKNVISNCVNSSPNVQTIFGSNTNYFYQILPKITPIKKRIDLIHALSERDERIQILVDTSKLIDYRVVITNKGKQDIISLYKENQVDLGLIKRITLIQNGISIENEMANQVDINQKSNFKIGFIGRWSEEKRPEIFLEVAKKIRTQFPDVEFVMAGTGMKSNISKITEAEVLFLGEIVDNQLLKQLYKSLDVIIISSVYEGFPMVIMESMIYGVIPISTNVGGIKEHISNNVNGILIENSNTQDLINDFYKNITSLILDPQKASKMSFEASNYATQNFSIEKFNTSYQDLFKI